MPMNLAELEAWAGAADTPAEPAELSAPGSSLSALEKWAGMTPAKKSLGRRAQPPVQEHFENPALTPETTIGQQEYEQMQKEYGQGKEQESAFEKHFNEQVKAGVGEHQKEFAERKIAEPGPPGVETGGGRQDKEADDAEARAALAETKKKFPSVSEKEFIDAYQQNVRVQRSATMLEHYKNRFLADEEKANPFEAMRRMPFVRHVIGFGEKKAVKEAAERIEAGTANEVDHSVVGRYMGRIQQAKDRGLGGDVANALLDMPAFMFEFGMGGSFKAAGFAKEKLLRLTGESLAGRAAAGLGGLAAGATTGTLTNPMMWADNAMQRQLPAMQVSKDDEGVARFQMAKSGEGLAESIVKGGADSWIEHFSELSGAGIMKGLGALGKPIKDRLVTAGIIRAMTKAGKPGMAAKFAEQVGYHGVVGEGLEERVGDVLRGLTISEDFGPVHKLISGTAEERAEAWKQLAVEGITFAVPGAIQHIASRKGLRDEERQELIASLQGVAIQLDAIAAQREETISQPDEITPEIFQ